MRPTDSFSVAISTSSGDIIEALSTGIYATMTTPLTAFNSLSVAPVDSVVTYTNSSYLVSGNLPVDISAYSVATLRLEFPSAFLIWECSQCSSISGNTMVELPIDPASLSFSLSIDAVRNPFETSPASISLTASVYV